MTGPLRRDTPADAFAAITDSPWRPVPGGLEFDDDLTEQQTTDVWWLMTSTSDSDEQARRSLADLCMDLRDLPASPDPVVEAVRQLVCELVDQHLGR